MTSPQFLDGKCLCSAVRYRIELPVEFCSHCHCESCRRSHGAPLVTWTSVPEDRFRLVQGAWDAEVASYRSSPEVTWHFCRCCGSRLFGRSAAAPGRIYATLASLEGSHEIRPDSHVSFEEKVPWLQPGDGLPCFRGKTEELPAPEFTATLPQLQAYVRDLCRRRGWDSASDLEIFLLFSEEVGELAKALRRHRKLFLEGASTGGGLAEEMADVLSYLLDLANRTGVDLETAFRDKERVNAKRSWT